MTVVFANNLATSLAGAIGAGDTSLVLHDHAGWPAIPVGDHAWVTLDDGAQIEIVRATAIAGSILTIERGQDGTGAAAFQSGAAVEMRTCAALLRDIMSSSGSGGVTHGTLYYGGSTTLLANFDDTTLASLATESDVPGDHTITIQPPLALDPADTYTAYIVTVDPSTMTEAIQTQIGFSYFSVFNDPSNRRDVTIGGDDLHLYSVPNNGANVTYPLRITLVR